MLLKVNQDYPLMIMHQVWTHKNGLMLTKSGMILSWKCEKLFVSTVLSQNERWYIDAPEYAALLAVEINIRKIIRKADEYLKDWHCKEATL